jgi:hypothetical protein
VSELHCGEVAVSWQSQFGVYSLTVDVLDEVVVIVCIISNDIAVDGGSNPGRSFNDGVSVMV